MLVEKYIDLNIPVLTPSDTIRVALKKFDEIGTEHLVVTDNGQYLGILLRTTAENVPDTKLKLEGIHLEGTTFAVNPYTHILEALKLCADIESDVLGVVEKDTLKYVGSITKAAMLQYFAEMYGVRTSGSVLVLNILERDYTMGELARIIEDNGSKIISLFTDVKEDDPYHVFVTLKLNTADISRVIAGLQRHNYIVLYTSHKEEFQNTDKDRLEHLLRFLEI